MDALNNLWENYTYEFSFAQKLIVGVVLGVIFSLALLAFVMLIIEMVG